MNPLPRRVVITGIGGISALGHDWQTIASSLKAKKNCVVRLDEWDKFEDLNTRLAAPITEFEKPAHYSRKKIRSMGRVSIQQTLASELPLMDANLLDEPVVTAGAMGIAYGPSTSSTEHSSGLGDMAKTGGMSVVIAHS